MEYGMGELFLSVGRDLSYEDEKIIRKKAADFQIEEVRGLCTALVENENPAKRRIRISVTMRLSEEKFQ
ncbi:hypothetical protein M5E84_06855 [[Ruminococcus] torques]|nr:hypothetical protein M5E84_06855 [[Ruminococcus] torques]